MSQSTFMPNPLKTRVGHIHLGIAVHFGSRKKPVLVRLGHPGLRTPVEWTHNRESQSEKYMSYSTGCTAWRKRETSPIFSSM